MAVATNHSLVAHEPTETSPEVTTLAGFLAGYSGRTREAYTLDLRQFVRWCGDRQIGLFEVTRIHIEVYARQLEDEGKAPATIGRRLSTLAGFYRYAAEKGVIEHSPAVHVRRPTALPQRCALYRELQRLVLELLRFFHVTDHVENVRPRCRYSARRHRD